jgi:hypothetical protein
MSIEDVYLKIKDINQTDNEEIAIYLEKKYSEIIAEFK